MVKKFHLGLIGYPLEHSLSPRLHQIMFDLAGISGNYQLYAIQHGENHRAEIEGMTELIRKDRIQGLNVTIPYKRTIMCMVDELSAEAHTIGAVNTIHKRNALLQGDNSDADGFYTDLIRVGYDQTHSGQRRVLIMGAGGAARAAAFSLLRNGWRVMVAARRIEQAEALAQDLNKIGTISTPSDKMETFLDDYDLIINATPLGMHPNIRCTPWPQEIPLPNMARVYDMIYNPAETLLMKTARIAGLQASNGSGMLVEQAAIAFETWTGVNIQREELFNAVSANNVFQRKG